MTPRSRTGRRRFLRTVGMAGVSSALAVPVMSLARGPGVPTQPVPASAVPPPPAPADTATAASKAPEISADARALAEIIERRYGEHLTKEQVESIRKDFDGDLKATKRLREVKLANSDEPDFTFKA
jgi:hypothetical protein